MGDFGNSRNNRDYISPRKMAELLARVALPKVPKPPKGKTLEDVKQAKEKAKLIFSEINVAVGLSYSKDGQLGVLVNIQGIPKGYTAKKLEKLLTENTKIDDIPVYFRVTGFAKPRDKKNPIKRPEKN